MNEQVQISELTPFAYERKCLEQPDSWMSWYVPGYAICQTDEGNRFFPLSAEEKEHFRYREAVEYEYLEDWEQLPESCREAIARLQETTEALVPLELVAVSLEGNRITLYHTELDTYFTVEQAHLQRLSPNTITMLAGLQATEFADARQLILGEDGSIVS